MCPIGGGNPVLGTYRTSGILPGEGIPLADEVPPPFGFAGDEDNLCLFRADSDSDTPTTPALLAPTAGGGFAGSGGLCLPLIF